MAECIFCKIAAGNAPAYKVYEDERYIAFLDIMPATKGQTIVVPKKHWGDYILKMPDQEYADLFLMSKKIAKGIDKALNTVRTCIVVEGFDSSHVHVRLHPCYEKVLKVIPTEKRPSEDEFNKVAEKISKTLEGLDAKEKS